MVTSQKTLGIISGAVVAAMALSAAAVSASPLTFTSSSFNTDGIVPSNAKYSYGNHNYYSGYGTGYNSYASEIDDSGNALFVSGLSNGSKHHPLTGGIPSSLSFTSAYDNSTVFDFGAPGTNNDLRVDIGQSSTMTLSSPAELTSLSLLMAFVDDPGQVSSPGFVTFNTAEGDFTTAYEIPNWDVNTSGSYDGNTYGVALSGKLSVNLSSGENAGGTSSGTSYLYQENFNLSDLAVIADTKNPSNYTMEDISGDTINSITITGAGDDCYTNVFAASGTTLSATPTPEPATIALFALAGAGILLIGRKRKSA